MEKLKKKKKKRKKKKKEKKKKKNECLSNFYCIKLDGIFHRPRQCDCSGYIVSNCMKDSVGQERLNMKVLLYKTGWKIP